MLRRRLTLLLLALAIVPMIGACIETCPEDDCAPLCNDCTSCTHAQLVVHAADVAPRLTIHRTTSQRPPLLSAGLAADIFHVPLAA